MEIVWKRKFEI